MERFKTIFGRVAQALNARKAGYHQVPVKRLFYLSVIGYIYLKLHHIPVSRSRFMKKIQERDEAIQISFENFAKSFILRDNETLRDIKTNELISEKTFAEYDYLLFYRGKFIDFFKLYKEYLNIIKPKQNAKMVYILQEEASKEIINSILKIDLKEANICSADEKEREEDLEELKSNTLLVMALNRKELIYSQEVKSTDYRIYMKNALIKMNRDKEKAYLASLDFKL